MIPLGSVLNTPDILPLVFLGLDAHTHAIQDVALSQLSTILPVLDFSTIKNDLFPLVAHVFSKTSSMAIKIRGLEAFNVLCGGTTVASSNANDLMGTQKKTNSSSAVLDKYTIQEKVVPLLKAIKTKEPAVSVSCRQFRSDLTANDCLDGSSRGLQASRQGRRCAFLGLRCPASAMAILTWPAPEPSPIPGVHDLDQINLFAHRG